MPMPNFAYIQPKSIQEAIKQLSFKGARVHAGGTDLLGCLRDEIFEAGKVVSLRQLKELRGVLPTKEGGLRIGALTTITEVANSQVIKERYPALAKAASEVASPQLRNQGTLGGNLCQKPRCWYYRGEFHCLRKGGDQCFAYEGENAYHCIFGGNMCYIVHPALFLRKSTYNRIGSYEHGKYLNACDYSLILRLGKEKCKVGHIPECLVNYRFHEHGQSADIRVMNNTERESIQTSSRANGSLRSISAKGPLFRQT